MPVHDITRRQLALLLSGAAAGLAVPGLAAAQGRKGVLVIGLDISDTVTFDPARQNNYSPPLTVEAAYDTLVTMTPGHYEDVVPNLATKWERTPDGQGWRFTLKQGVKFSSGSPVTPEDWKFTFDRILAIKDQTAQYIGNVKSVEISGPDTLDIILKEPAEPLMGIIAAPGFGVLEKKVVQAHGGTDQPGADKTDAATEWLNQNSAGSGAYVLAGWARNQQIQLAANPNSWRGPSHYQRIVIRHIPDSAAQLLAVQRGDIDAAFNLIPEQIATLQNDKSVRIEGLRSLDFVYLAVNSNPELNKALAVQEAREAIGWAIDYDGLLNKMLGGQAVRPASFLPIGVRGSTEEIAKQIGFHEDLDKSRQLLKQANLPDGFEFELSYGNAAIAGISYQTLAQKLQSDLRRVGIRAKLNPMDQVNLRTQYLGGRSQSVITFWNPPAVENKLWAAATVERVSRRVDFHPPADLVALINRAAAEADKDKASELWVEYQKRMVEFANLIILFQPIYQVAVRNTVGAFPLTAAGWMADLDAAAPATDLILLTHTDEARDLYYGKRAQSALEALGVPVRLNRTGKPLEGDALVEAAQGAKIIVADRAVPAPAALFERLPELVAFVRGAVDIRTVDVEAASRAGVLVTHASPGFVPAVCELVLGLMVDLSRGVSDAVAQFRAGRHPPVRMGRQIAGSTVGVIGYGAIGRRLSRLLLALEAHVLVSDPHAEVTDGPEQVPLADLLARSDTVVCAAIANAETANLLNAETIGAMKRGAYPDQHQPRRAARRSRARRRARSRPPRRRRARRRPRRRPDAEPGACRPPRRDRHAPYRRPHPRGGRPPGAGDRAPGRSHPARRRPAGRGQCRPRDAAQRRSSGSGLRRMNHARRASSASR